MENRAPQRLARLYNAEEAQIILETLPDDLSEEEVDSDPEDPTYEPELQATLTGNSEENERRGTVEASNVLQESTQNARERRWKKQERPDMSLPFEKTQGPMPKEFENCDKPIDFFLKYFDRDIEENILTQTNLYRLQKDINGSAFTLETLRGFLGINMVMGYHVLPSYKHYWSGQPDLGVPLVSSTMSKNRFELILTTLHVNDNSVTPPTPDKLWKLRPLIDSLNENYAKLYDMKREQSVDESMVLFKGRSALKQYCPMKPVKRGYKLWVIADMDGYISKFEIYQGKNTGAATGFGLGEGVVIRLTEGLAGGNHKVYFDNFFTSLPLLSYLLDINIYGCGTVRANRKGLPSGMKEDRSLVRGDFDHRVSDDNLLVVKWRDNKAVLVASNFHSSDATTVLRTQKDGTRKEVACPVAIKEYNNYMGGVDKADMLASAYGLSRKSKKWWHRLFFGLIDRTIVNSYIAYNNITGSKGPLLEFLREVALALITLSRPPRVGRPLNSPCPSPIPPAKKRRKEAFSVPDGIRLSNVGIHYVIYVDERKRCEVCAKKQIQSRPHSKCKLCNVFLCSNEKKNCFLEFHDIST